jgi:probable HAF family extracellular repeat protein
VVEHRQLGLREPELRVIPDSTSSTAVAINDKGQVLGNRSTAGGERRGFVYYQGTQRDLAGIAGVPTGFMDINNAGYITAGAYIDPPGNQHVYLRAPDGSLRDIGALPAAVRPSTVGGALNNRNQIAGGSGPLTFPEQPYRAILWDKGVMRDLGDFGWAPNIGNAINDRGQVAGYATLPVGLHNQCIVYCWCEDDPRLAELVMEYLSGYEFGRSISSPAATGTALERPSSTPLARHRRARPDAAGHGRHGGVPPDPRISPTCRS